MQKKCHILKMGHGKNRPVMEYRMGMSNINVVKEEKDL